MSLVTRRDREGSSEFTTTEGNGRPKTYGSRYIFAAVDLSEISGRFRVNYTFTPNLNGTTITRNTDGSHTVTDGATTFDIDPEDFNVRSFRSNAVLRWEWRPGSTMYDDQPTRGSVSVNVEPLPGASRTARSPCIARARSRLMARPRPAP